MNSWIPSDSERVNAKLGKFLWQTVIFRVAYESLGGKDTKKPAKVLFFNDKFQIGVLPDTIPVISEDGGEQCPDAIDQWYDSDWDGAVRVTTRFGKKEPMNFKFCIIEVPDTVCS